MCEEFYFRFILRHRWVCIDTIIDYKVDIEVIPRQFFIDIPTFTQFSLTLMIKERERATMYNAKIFTYILYAGISFTLSK